ncbi:hypothetical protein L486_07057 [Kwoniella mangroviensis CBS 10435]|uniref:Major facilitator superfamily (MFS) profile domain-containing protein n=1 Tax=Kwoniella mangroviensis CBS 10435 TaxID=1331196 RepID=A0A1B9IJC4_9TREE|nr:hypothetical protein L486_07057 [Kwoniella mangroviensis CBS 10435]
MSTIDDKSSVDETEDANAFLASHAIGTYTDESNKKLLRRIDMYLMPMMCISYCIQYIDKSALAYAAVFGVKKDLGLVGQEYSLLTSLFYIGYLVAEYPQAWLSQRYHIGRFLGVIMFIWGGILMCSAATQKFADIAAVRFFQGVFESALTPAYIIVTGMWYTRREQPFRVAIWYSMNGLGNAIGALISYGMGLIDGKLDSWRYIFIIEGVMTIIWSFAKVQAAERIRSNRTGILNREWKWHQVKEALDPRIDPSGHILFWACVLNEVINGGVSTYKGLVIKSIGWTDLQSSLFGIAYGAAVTIEIASCGYCAMRFKNARHWCMILWLLPSAIGMILQITLPTSNKAGKTIGVLLMPSFVGSSALCMGIPGQNTAGFTKRSVVVGMAFIGYCVGNIIGPLAWVSGQTPAYMSGYTTCLACMAGQVVLFLLLRIYYARQNKLRDKMVAAGQAPDPSIPDGGEFEDLTDKQDLKFRYTL